MLPNKTIEKISFEIGEIDKLIEQSMPLISLCKIKTPDFIEIMAAATVLHSFYNGIENIFVVIAKEVDKKIPDGQKWHKVLLEQMQDNGIISEEVLFEISKYLLFRHFFRHAYSFRLEWEEMNELVYEIENTWIKLKEELNKFILSYYP